MPETLPAPWEFTQYRLCRYVYHCTPSELDQEERAVVDLHLRFATEEALDHERRHPSK